MRAELKKVGWAVLLWFVYSVEFVLLIIPLEYWFDLPWVNSSAPVGFFDGVGWMFLASCWTIITIAMAQVVINEES